MGWAIRGGKDSTVRVCKGWGVRDLGWGGWGLGCFQLAGVGG